MQPPGQQPVNHHGLNADSITQAGSEACGVVGDGGVQEKPPPPCRCRKQATTPIQEVAATDQWDGPPPASAALGELGWGGELQVRNTGRNHKQRGRCGDRHEGGPRGDPP